MKCIVFFNLLMFCLPMSSQAQNNAVSLENGIVNLDYGYPRQLTPPGSRVELDVPDFDPKNAEQETAEWCWAACIQAILRSRNLSVTQKQIVTLIKGNISLESATADEINTFFIDGKWISKKWTNDPDTKAYSNHFSSAQWKEKLNQNFIIRHLGVLKSPAILSFKRDDGSNHAMVAYKVAFEVGNSIISLSIFDPETGKQEELSFDKMEEKISDIWLPYFMGRTF